MRLLLAPAVALTATLLLAQAPDPVPPVAVTAGEKQQIAAKADQLEAALKALPSNIPGDLADDAAVYLKAARYILRFNEFYSKAYVAQTLTVLDTGLARAKELAMGTHSWTGKTGSLSRAYRSRVDDSLQPYAVTIPAKYDPRRPQWLEVNLHGRGATLNEVSFLYSHDRAKPANEPYEFIKLDVFGRANVAYRWAGETEVFEAIDSVRKRYNIDPAHIALRGFSMGGGGAWHLGLHFPDQWSVVEAGAGFVETKEHGGPKTPEPTRYAAIYDVLDVALNAVNTPWSGYGGEIDPQRRASVFIREALTKEGYKFQKSGMDYTGVDLNAIFLTGPQTAHKFHPDSKKVSDAFVLQNQSHGLRDPDQLRFVTYTERYNKCFWLTVDQLEQQYQRAQVDATIDGHDMSATTKNVARLTFDLDRRTLGHFILDGQSFPASKRVSFEKVDGKWRVARKEIAGKRHGLQGPIDDAFMDAFVCVKPEPGKTSPVSDYAVKQFDRFAADFPKWMRGDVQVASASTDARQRNVIAFGTPSTNPLIASAMKHAPIQWTAKSIVAGSQSFDAATHMLSMIYPNPASPNHYIVVNSGHTFHEPEFKGTNVLLFPRVGDWAVTEIATGKVVAEGAFDRNWKLASR